VKGDEDGDQRPLERNEAAPEGFGSMEAPMLIYNLLSFGLARLVKLSSPTPKET
jgi:hypothetical protein